MATAASLNLDVGLSGQAISQQFLPSGASIVITTEARACVVSRRIGIEASTYKDTDGSLVAFDQIRRSIAASVQAVWVQDVNAPAVQDVNASAVQTGFRVQLKFSPALQTPILLSFGGQTRDVQDLLEPSTDSLWIDGPLAAALQAAFGAGERPVLQSTSGDTAHLVTDRLDTPDLAALVACQALLAAPMPAQRHVALPLTNEIRVTFRADPVTTPLASLPELRVCGMTDQPGELHLARLEAVTGFFAQTDKVFVSFDAAGQVAQVYIPGIFDGDFRNGGHQVRLSRAADGNVPMAQNMIKGCLGAAAVNVCHYNLANGEHLLAACIGSGEGQEGGFVPETIAAYIPQAASSTSGAGRGNGGTTPGFTPNPPGGTGGGLVPPAGGGGTVPPAGGGGTVPPNGGGGGDPDPSPVPLPASALLLLAALAGLYGMRSRTR